MDTHRIGVDDERAARRAQFHEAEGLLRPTERQADDDAYDGTQGGNQTPLEEENARNLLVGRTQVAQRHHIVFLVDDEHRE